MTLLINLLVAAACAAPAPKMPNDELARAIMNLQGKIEVVRTGKADRLLKWGKWLAVKSFYLAGAAALAGTVPPKIAEMDPELVKNLMQARMVMLGAATVGVKLAGPMLLIGWVSKKLRGRPRVKAIGDYQSIEGVNEFFQLRPEEQYALASRDAEFARFLIELSAARDAVAHPDPKAPRWHPAPPAQFNFGPDAA